jgi:hypothetical protein
MSEVKNSSIVNNIKLWAFPSLVTILAMMIWRDVTELKSDVKQLLAESASNKTKVERLERQVDMLNQAVFKMPKPISNNDGPNKKDATFGRVEAILNKDDYNYYIKKEQPYKTI